MPPQNGFAVSKHLDLLRLKPHSFQKWHQKFVLQKTPTVSQNKNASAQRSQACPACRKPLPRCSVCLIHMGGIAAVEGGFLVKKSAKRKTKPFSLFFTWCQYYKTFLIRQGQMKYTKVVVRGVYPIGAHYLALLCELGVMEKNYQGQTI